MTKNQTKTIINSDFENLTFAEINALQPLDILKVRDFSAIAESISSYFEQHTVTATFDNIKTLVYKLPNSKHHEYLTLNTHIAFNIKVKDIASSSLVTKLKRLKNKDYLTNFLKERACLSREVNNFHYEKSSSYITEKCLKQYKQKEINVQKFFDVSYKLSSTGNYYQRLDLAKLAKNKASEVYSNAIQIGDYATDRNFHYLFVTITPPPIFHVKPKNEHNSWNKQFTPKENNDFNNKIWVDSRKRWKARGIECFGHWSKEPSESMALHSHILIYADEKNISTIIDIIDKYAFTEYSKLDCDYIDNVSVKFDTGKCETPQSNNSNHQIISNYINKHILQCLSKPKNKAEQAEYERIIAHADKFKYRRFGFFGLENMVTIWKTLKQLDYSKQYNNTSDKVLASLLNMANKNKLKHFIQSPYRKLIKLLKNNVSANKFGDSFSKIIGLTINRIDYITSVKSKVIIT